MATTTNTIVGLILENLKMSLSAADIDYFVFLNKAQSIICNIISAEDAKNKNMYLELVKKQIKENSKYQNIFKDVHHMQDNILLQIENRQKSIFGGGAGHTNEQMKNMQMLFFCATYDPDLEFLFELDVRYTKIVNDHFGFDNTPKMDIKFIRNKEVLSNKKVLFPFYRMIADLCFEADRQDGYKRIKLVLEFLEKISPVAEHAPDKLHPVVSAYSYLAFAIMISSRAFYEFDSGESSKLNRLKFELPIFTDFTAKVFKEQAMGYGVKSVDDYAQKVYYIGGYYANASL